MVISAMTTAVSISTGSVLGGAFLLVNLIGKDGRSLEAFIYAQLSELKTQAKGGRPNIPKARRLLQSKPRPSD